MMAKLQNSEAPNSHFLSYLHFLAKSQKNDEISTNALICHGSFGQSFFLGISENGTKNWPKTRQMVWWGGVIFNDENELNCMLWWIFVKNGKYKSQQNRITSSRKIAKPYWKWTIKRPKTSKNDTKMRGNYADMVVKVRNCPLLGFTFSIFYKNPPYHAA